MPPWNVQEIPDQRGRVAIVTGANVGLGSAVTEALVRAGATVVMACRSVGRGHAALARIESGRPPGPGRAVVWELDLASPRSIESFTSRFHAHHDGLDLLINNAGIMAVPAALTPDGVESQWAVNHLGHFALTGRLLPALIDRESRVVSVSSLAAVGRSLDGHDPTSLDGYSRFGAYAATKLANQVFAVELNHRLREVGSRAVSLAAHPGISHTRLIRSTGLGLAGPVALALSRLAAQPAAGGALPILRAATDPEAEGGQYYGPAGRRQYRGPARQILLTPAAADRATGRRLWRQSIELSGVAYLDL